MRIKVMPTLLLVALLLSGISAGAEESNLPKGWFSAGSDPNDYEMGVDTTVRHSGKNSGFIKAKSSDPKGFATLMQTFKADDYRGKRLRMSAHVKTDRISGWAGLWMRIDSSDGKTVAFDNMQDRKIQGSTDWKKYEIILDVPEESDEISFGLLSAGKGQAWVADFKFEVVSKEVRPTQTSLPKKPLNLDFKK